MKLAILDDYMKVALESADWEPVRRHGVEITVFDTAFGSVEDAAAKLAPFEIVNLLRVVALFLTGAYFPRLFDASHTVVWQTVVILAGVLLWIYWASRFAAPRRPPASA